MHVRNFRVFLNIVSSDWLQHAHSVHRVYEFPVIDFPNLFSPFKSSCICAIAGQNFLKSSKTNKDKFERGQTDEFVIEAVQIGEIQKIR